jgi:hypothetical protein
VRLRDAVDQHRIDAERLADVAQRAARAVGRSRRRRARRDRGRTSVDVLDDLFAALVLEVDVDVGRLVALSLMKRSNSIVL